MPTKKRLLEEIEKEVVDQEKEKTELEESEEVTGKKLDIIQAPALDVGEELEKEWKHEEKEQELKEETEFTDESLKVEEEEEKGEEPYPEIEKAIREVFGHITTLRASHRLDGKFYGLDIEERVNRLEEDLARANRVIEEFVMWLRSGAS